MSRLRLSLGAQLLLCGAVLPLCFKAQAVPAPSLAVTKVTSGSCAATDSTRAISGSGVLVSVGTAGDLYVLTGSHVIYHGGRSDGICFDILLEGEMETPATKINLPRSCVDFFSANLLQDLALLKIDSSCLEPTHGALVRNRAIAIERFQKGYAALKEAAADQFPQVSITGFPSGLTDRRTYRGAIQAFDSARHLIAGVDGLFEVAPMQVSSVTSEFGMSGGLIASATEIAGLSAQHFFRILPGQPAVVGSVDPNPSTPIADPLAGLAIVVTLGLPGDAIYRWVNQAVSSEHRGRFTAVLSLQKLNQIGVEFAGVRLTEQNCSHLQSWWIGGHGVSIGGGASPGHGPIDNCTIRVDYLATPLAQVWPWAESAEIWREMAQTRQAGEIRSVRPPQGEDRSIGSLSGLLKAVRQGFRPVLAQSWQIDDATWTQLRTRQRQSMETSNAARDWIRLLPGGLATIAEQKTAYQRFARALVEGDESTRPSLWTSWALLNADGRTLRADSEKKLHLAATGAIDILQARGDGRGVCAIRKLSFGLYLWGAQSNDLMDDTLRTARLRNPNVVTGFPEVQLDSLDFWSFVLMGVSNQEVSAWWDCLATAERQAIWRDLAAEEKRSLTRSVEAFSTYRDAVSDLYRLINP